MNRQAVKLGRVARTIGGVGFPHEFQGGAGVVPFIKVSDLGLPENQAGIVTANNFVSDADVKTLGARIAPKGSIVFPKVGAALLNNPRSLLMRPVAMDNNLMAVAPHWGDPRYWYYALQTIDLAELSGSGPLPFVTEGQVRDLRLPFPLELAEQRRIADFLDAEIARIDRIVELRKQARDLVYEKRDARLRFLLAGPTSQESSWPLLKLKQRWRVIDCKHRTPTYLPHGYPVVSPGDVSVGRLDLSRAHRFVGEDDFRELADAPRRCRKGDIVYSRNASVGTAAYVDTDEPFTMGQDVCRITSTDQNQLFLSFVLNYTMGSQLDSMSVGSTFMRINVERILNLQLRCPPPQEQRVIAEECDVVNRHCDVVLHATYRHQQLLLERRRALIAAAVTGQIDVSTAGRAA